MRDDTLSSFGRLSTRLLLAAFFVSAALCAEAGQAPSPATPESGALQVFDVAAITPSKPGAGAKSIEEAAAEFHARNATARELLAFAFGVHAVEIAGAPEWCDTEKYDVAAKPAMAGRPTDAQWRSMVQNLLLKRFALAYHRDQREIPVYVLAIAKGGPKLALNDGDYSGAPLLVSHRHGNLPARNATMSDLALVLQIAVLDRPVINRTGLGGKFDFALNWTPDASQYDGVAGQAATNEASATAAAPDLFTAIQQQLGLKLDAGNAPADVIVIDHIERPAAH